MHFSMECPILILKQKVSYLHNSVISQRRRNPIQHLNHLRKSVFLCIYLFVSFHRLETNLTIIYANYANARRTSLEALGPSLSNLNNWDCDAFELQNMTGGSGLSCAGYHVISRHDLFTRLPVSTDKLASYLYNVEAGYMTNPYHNSTHATDVLLACNYLVRSGGLDKYLSHFVVVMTFVVVAFDISTEY